MQIFSKAPVLSSDEHLVSSQATSSTDTVFTQVEDNPGRQSHTSQVRYLFGKLCSGAMVNGKKGKERIDSPVGQKQHARKNQDNSCPTANRKRMMNIFGALNHSSLGSRGSGAKCARKKEVFSLVSDCTDEDGVSDIGVGVEHDAEPVSSVPIAEGQVNPYAWSMGSSPPCADLPVDSMTGAARDGRNSASSGGSGKWLMQFPLSTQSYGERDEASVLEAQEPWCPQDSTGFERLGNVDTNTIEVDRVKSLALSEGESVASTCSSDSQLEFLVRAPVMESAFDERITGLDDFRVDKQVLELLSSNNRLGYKDVGDDHVLDDDEFHVERLNLERAQTDPGVGALRIVEALGEGEQENCITARDLVSSKSLNMRKIFHRRHRTIDALVGWEAVDLQDFAPVEIEFPSSPQEQVQVVDRNVMENSSFSCFEILESNRLGDKIDVAKRDEGDEYTTVAVAKEVYEEAEQDTASDENMMASPLCAGSPLSHANSTASSLWDLMQDGAPLIRVNSPPARANSTESLQWEQMQETAVVSEQMKKIFDSGSEPERSGSEPENPGTGPDQFLLDTADLIATGSNELAIPAKEPEDGSPSSEQIHFLENFRVSAMDDDFERLLDNPMDIGHKRLETVLEEPATSEEFLDDSQSDLFGDRSGRKKEGPDESWVFAGSLLPDTSPLGTKLPFASKTSLEGSSQQQQDENQNLKALTVLSDKRGTVQDGTIGSSLSKTSIHVRIDSLDESSVFDKFNALNPEISEIFGRPLFTGDEIHVAKRGESRSESRRSDPGTGAARQRPNKRATSFRRRRIIRWLRILFARKASDSPSDVSSLGGSDKDECATRDLLPTCQRHCRQASAGAGSSISLSDGIIGASPEPWLEGSVSDGQPSGAPDAFPDVGPEYARPLYMELRETLNGADIDVNKWDQILDRSWSAVEFFDLMTHETERVGLDLISMLEEIGGKNHPAVAAFRARRSGEDVDISCNHGEGHNVLSAKSSPGEDRNLIRDGRPTTPQCLYVLDVLSECGFNAMFFDRDMKEFSSESEYYNYLARRLSSEGVKVTQELKDRLGSRHPLLVTLEQRQRSISNTIREENENMRPRLSLGTRLKGFFSLRRWRIKKNRRASYDSTANNASKPHYQRRKSSRRWQTRKYRSSKRYSHIHEHVPRSSMARVFANLDSVYPGPEYTEKIRCFNGLSRTLVRGGRSPKSSLNSGKNVKVFVH